MPLNIPVFPLSLATDINLSVAKNNSISTLTSAINNSTTSVPVADGTQFTAYEVITCDLEQMQITLVSGNTLTVTRGFDGSTAAAHNSGATVYGFVAAYGHNQLGAEVKAIEAQLGTNLCNITHSFRYPSIVTATWIRLGTWIFNAYPSSLRISLVNGAGFNSNTNQSGLTEILIRSGNGTAAPNAGVPLAYTFGNSVITSVKLVDPTTSGSSTNNAWDVYVQTSGAFQGGIYTITTEPGDVWVNICNSTVDPGTASTSLVVGVVCNPVSQTGGLIGPTLSVTGLATVGGFGSAVRTVTTSTDLATTSDATLLLNNTSLVESMPSSPGSGQNLTLCNITGSTLTVNGNGRNITSNGTSASTLSLSPNTAVTLQYDSGANLWRNVSPVGYTTGTLLVAPGSSTTTTLTKTYNELFVKVDCTNGPQTIQLYASADAYKIHIKKIDSTPNAVTITVGTGNIDNGVGTGASISAQNNGWSYWGDATNWETF